MGNDLPRGTQTIKRIRKAQMSSYSELIRLRSQDRPILVTGHNGFKGTWLGMLLSHYSVPFIGLALPATSDSMYQKVASGKPLREYIADIRNYRHISEIIERERPSGLLHLAAQPLVIEASLTPLETFETNTIGTANLLEAFRQHSPKSPLAIITTDKVYQPSSSARHRHKEEDPLFGTEPYSSSKVGAENAITAWRSLSTGSQPILALRSGNVIGGGDSSANRLLPDLIRNYASDKQLKIRHPSATRPWQHVLDPLFGYLLAMEYAFDTGKHDVFNFGPSEPSLSVKEVVQIADNAWDGRKRSLTEGSVAKNETKDLDLDSTYAMRILGWTPKMNQTQAVISTISWWKNALRFSYDEATFADLESFRSVDQ